MNILESLGFTSGTNNIKIELSNKIISLIMLVLLDFALGTNYTWDIIS